MTAGKRNLLKYVGDVLAEMRRREGRGGTHSERACAKLEADTLDHLTREAGLRYESKPAHGSAHRADSDEKGGP